MTRPPAHQRITHYENFPVASVLCPAHLRTPIAALYHFARTADDIADEGQASAQQRLYSLNAYRQQLATVIANPGIDADTLEPRWAGLFAALGKTLQQHALPGPLLHALLDAFAQDIAKTRDAAGYATEAELRDYCRRSANPIGRLLLHLHGINSAEALRESDALCTALQLINFWQDPSVDIPRGRYYFSQEMQQRHAVAEADLLARHQTPAITRMVQDCVQTARATLLQGSPLVHRLRGRAGWELRLVIQGGLCILDKIAALHYATLRQRPTLKTSDYLPMLWRALWM
ncbi:MAG: squalene synthase HpnC [Rhodoferax sp.]|nr:squalene synthase HpnC [Rhodoferax sp.]